MEKILEHQPRTAVEAVQMLLSQAMLLRASDIHIDPKREDIRIKLRIDGLLSESGSLPKRLLEELIARLKILSGARTDLHVVPQDGRFGTDINGEAYNIRVSFMPTYHGENAVLRLLPVKPADNISFESLGFTIKQAAIFRHCLSQSSGLILVTGPTGSGKTTTLHAMLAEKSREALSILTLEDPIEYEIAGVRQIHIRHTHGVSFAGGLRAALRQDPDVIMVGEIRDGETAHVAVETALTGHLVLSSLHTKSALEAVTRLRDMGIEPYLLGPTLRLLVAQRLVRNICRECEGIGCGLCRESGYRGRSIICEVCEIDADLQGLLSSGESAGVLEAAAKMCGFAPLRDDGFEKVDWGVTDSCEVARVLSS